MYKGIYVYIISKKVFIIIRINLNLKLFKKKKKKKKKNIKIMFLGSSFIRMSSLKCNSF